MSLFKFITGATLKHTIIQTRNYAGRSIFVGNLSFTTSEKALKDHFAQKVEVLDVRIPKNEFQKNRGFGFVEVDEADLNTAVESLNGTTLDGRDIRCNEAQSDKRSSPRNFNQRE